MKFFKCAFKDCNKLTYYTNMNIDIKNNEIEFNKNEKYVMCQICYNCSHGFCCDHQFVNYHECISNCRVCTGCNHCIVTKNFKCCDFYFCDICIVRHVNKYHGYLSDIVKKEHKDEIKRKIKTMLQLDNKNAFNILDIIENEKENMTDTAYKNILEKIMIEYNKKKT